MKRLVGILWIIIISQASYANYEIVVIEIFDKLWEQLQSNDDIKPELTFMESDDLVANYSPSNNKVSISHKAIKACQKTSDFQASISFILAHEMAHTMQDQIVKYNIKTNFLKFDRQHRTRRSLEENADLNGAFTAYLSGYNVLPVIDETLEFIYEDFGLKNRNIPGYPSFEERKATSQTLLKDLEHLIQLYDLGTYMIILQQYDFAIPFFEEILKEYKGPEIYNNIAVALALEALNYKGYNFENYIYPFEVEFETRLKKPRIDLNSKDMPIEIQLKRSELLKTSKMYLEKGRDLYPDYFKTIDNYICVLNMMGYYQEALIEAKDGDTANSKLLEAITILNIGDNDGLAKSLLNDIIANDQGKQSHIAAENLKRINCDDSNLYSEADKLRYPTFSLVEMNLKYLETIGNDSKYFYQIINNSEDTISYVIGNELEYIKLEVRGELLPENQNNNQTPYFIETAMKASKLSLR